MKCVPITGLKLDNESKAALKRIKDKRNLANALSAVLTVGVFNSIFTKSSAPQAAYNITQTDWNLYSEAMAALPKIQKGIIEKEIDMMIIHYQLGEYNHKLTQFWKGMKEGCR